MTIGSSELSEGPAYYYLALTILVLCYLGCRFIVRSQFGLALAGVREQEARVAFFGYRASRIKAVVFCLSGAMAGLSGGLYTFHEGFIWPTVLGIILLPSDAYVLFGGAGTLLGAVIGTIIIETMSFWLSGTYQENLAHCPWLAVACSYSVSAEWRDRHISVRARARRFVWSTRTRWHFLKHAPSGRYMGN